jgi:WD40 repeat-containing protein SMU1
MEQFLAENGLRESLRAMETETQVSLNTVVSVDAVLKNVHSGHWDEVLASISSCQLSIDLQEKLFEQICRELIEEKETDAAGIFLSESNILIAMKTRNPDKYQHLEQLLRVQRTSAGVFTDPLQRRVARQQCAGLLRQELRQAEPSRLLSLLGEAMQWQLAHNSSQQPVLFSAATLQGSGLGDSSPSLKIKWQMDVGQAAHIECVAFAEKHPYIALGTMDGAVDLRHCLSGESIFSHEDPPAAQADDDGGGGVCLLPPEAGAVVQLCYLEDDQYIVAGSAGGSVYVLAARGEGQLIRTLTTPHTQGLSLLQTHPQQSGTLIAGGFEGIVTWHGLRGSAVLKHFTNGHSMAVNGMVLTEDGGCLSISSDGTLCQWQLDTMQRTNSRILQDGEPLLAIKPTKFGYLILTNQRLTLWPDTLGCCSEKETELLQQAKPLATTDAIPGGVASMAIASASSNIAYLLATSGDLHHYHLPSLQLLHQHSAFPTITQPGSSDTAIGVATNGRYTATFSEKGQFVLYDSASSAS